MISYLVAKLVTGERKDFQLIAKLFLKLVHLQEVPRGRASEGGRVLDQHYLAAVLAERHHLTCRVDKPFVLV